VVAPIVEGVADEEPDERERAVADVQAHPEEGVEEGRRPDDVQAVEEGDAGHRRERQPLRVGGSNNFVFVMVRRLRRNEVERPASKKKQGLAHRSNWRDG